MKYKIHHEGIWIIVSVLLFLLIVNFMLWGLCGNSVLNIIISSFSLIFFLLIVNFFRSPHRHFSGDRDNVVVASADGKVVAVEEVEENDFLHEKAIQVSIFMSVFNVHANWFPVDGEVLHVEHQSGRFRAAYLPKSSVENERSAVLIKAHNGSKVLVRQIAGAIARRIVTYPTVGDEASIDNHFGFIKFGSRIDIYLPLSSKVYVKIGDKTIGGVSAIAKLQ